MLSFFFLLLLFGLFLLFFIKDNELEKLRYFSLLITGFIFFYSINLLLLLIVLHIIFNI